LFKALTI